MIDEAGQEALAAFAFGQAAPDDPRLAAAFGRSLGEGDAVEVPPGGIVFVVAGEVALLHRGRRVARLGAGQILGRLDAGPAPLEARAAAPTALLALDAEAFRMVFQLHPDWTHRILNDLTQRLVACYRRAAAPATAV